MTAYAADYIEDIFLNQVNLCGFLMKPVKLEQLERNLEKAIKSVSSDLELDVDTQSQLINLYNV